MCLCVSLLGTTVSLATQLNRSRCRLGTADSPWALWTVIRWQRTSSPPGEYDGMICAAVMRTVATITAETCLWWFFEPGLLFTVEYIVHVHGCTRKILLMWVVWPSAKAFVVIVWYFRVARRYCKVSCMLSQFCRSVRLSHSWVLSKRLKLNVSLNFFIITANHSGFSNESLRLTMSPSMRAPNCTNWS